MNEKEYDEQMLKYMKRVAMSNRVDQVIVRGCLIGIFSAIGTTIGFALLLGILVQSIFNLRSIPIIDDIVRETKIDLILENQLAQINSEVVQTDSETETVGAQERYVDSAYNISFSYPSTFTSISQSDTAIENSKILKFSGEGALQVFDVFINTSVNVSGESSQRFVQKAAIDRIVVDVYESGALVGDREVTNAVYVSEFQYEENSYQFIGIADPAKPKLGREVFLSIINSTNLGS